MKLLFTIVLVVGLATSMLVLGMQQAKAIVNSPENEAKFQKFRTECSSELGLSSTDSLKDSQMTECVKALKNADPVIRQMVFQLNEAMSGLQSRLDAIKSGKCHLNQNNVMVCKGLDY